MVRERTKPREGPHPAAAPPLVAALADETVPRYTSYPTAPHFSPAVDADVYADWLARLPPGATISLYLHVPFCEQLCHYCGCHTKATRRREPVEAYAERLADEIRLVGARLRGCAVTEIHWGGGTPSILGERGLVSLAEAIVTHFDTRSLRHHAIELDPRHVDPALARTLAALGVNRASLGAQDFSPHVQAAIGRIQPFAVVRQAAAALREAGIERINLDMMYGLPRQRVADVRRSAELAASLRPRRLAYFGYAHVPWARPHQRLIDEAALPAAAERLAQAEAARESLTAAGYVPVGLDHFARPDDDLAVAARTGRLRRNFQGYSADDADALIGLGASAIGRLPQGYAQNARDTAGYARAVAAGALAVVKGVALSAEDRVRGRIIERLMCDLAVDLDAIEGAGGHDFAAELALLSAMDAEGLVSVRGRRVAVTARGRPYLRLVAAVFDRYRAAAGARYSRAI